LTSSIGIKLNNFIAIVDQQPQHIVRVNTLTSILIGVQNHIQNREVFTSGEIGQSDL